MTARWRVNFEFTVHAFRVVEASSEEEALRTAKERFGDQTFTRCEVEDADMVSGYTFAEELEDS